MPELFIPLFICLGTFIGFGFASIPDEGKERTFNQEFIRALAVIAFIGACGFGGGLISTYVPPVQGCPV